jgi:membrane protein YqaA with SNARE-associated domain
MLLLYLLNHIWKTYLLLFFWSFLAATILPGTSEVYLVYLINENSPFWLPVLVATLGNSLGGISTYYIGYFSANYLEKRKKLKDKYKLNDKATHLIKKYGSFALILSWVPLIGDILVGIAGAMKLPKTPSFLWMTLGKFLRYLFIALTTLGVITYYH